VAKVPVDAPTPKVIVPIGAPFLWTLSTVSAVAAILAYRSTRQRRRGSPRGAPGRSPQQRARGAQIRQMHAHI
jgi:hypothetical protein